MERMEPAAETAREERRIECPWCESEDVEMVSEYGPHMMVSQYICRECHSPFEVIRR